MPPGHSSVKVIIRNQNPFWPSGTVVTVERSTHEFVTVGDILNKIREVITERCGPDAILHEALDLVEAGNDEAAIYQNLYDHEMANSPGTNDHPEHQMNFHDFHHSRDAENHDGVYQGFYDISGGYTEQDNRRINRNVEFARIYVEGDNINNKFTVDGDWKAFCAGGSVATTAFYGGLTTAQGFRACQPALQGNLLTFVVLPTVLMQFFSAIRHSILTAFE
ncbi:hypothetical protein K435DRAFT_961935 [Dendrothele bispora CBS 962.96]|uniref:Uncharacterized protein n=1 Tax=Dendrothele bispora (strain CBS 962.96) TaxID=1314807 RepID=A0A4S8MN05_DENBC|nr:hypothetical protein K435DRAFT_961935 [Dendrothele bispora CBS 962.96]